MSKHEYFKVAIIGSMSKLDKAKILGKSRKAILVRTVGLFIFILLGLLILHYASPKRSVAAYCQAYKEEKSRLTQLPGSTWPSGVFDDRISDAGEFAKSFGRLEKVAPNEITPDIRTLQGVYQKIHDDPSQAVSASLSGVSADESVKKWTRESCR